MPAKLPVLTVHAPIILLLLSTLTWRARESEVLRANPFDAFALLRAGLVAAATLLALPSIYRFRVSHWAQAGVAPRLLLAYVVSATPGIFLSVDPVLTSLRVLELGLFVAIPLATFAAYGPGVVALFRRLVIGSWWVLTAATWLNVALIPEAVHRISAPLPWQIESVYPAIAANGVGTYGVLLATLGLGRLLSLGMAQSARGAAIPLGLGLVTLLAAQYRTGYVALLVVLAITPFAVRRRLWILPFLVATGALLADVGGARGEFTEFFLRGGTWETAMSLSGRRSWWGQALVVFGESPLFGKGLLTASRFEVLVPMGFTMTSTVHSVWIEALVGTGVIGAGLLFLAALSALVRGWREARELGDAVAFGICVVLVVRSLTGSAFEIAGPLTLAFMAFAMPARTFASGLGGPAKRSGSQWGRVRQVISGHGWK